MSNSAISTNIIKLHRCLVDVLQCPLVIKHTNKVANHLKDDNDDDDLFALFESVDSQLAFSCLQPFIIPGHQRLNLFEWLLDRFEHGFTTSIENENRDLKLDQVDVIERAMRELGITNFFVKGKSKASNGADLAKSIEGLNGTNDSIDILLRLSQFVINAH